MGKTAGAVSTSTSVIIAAGAVLLLSGCGIGTPMLRGSNGKLQPCPDAPHCVSSQDARSEHHVDALHYTGTRDAARQALIQTLERFNRVKITAIKPDYVHAEFSSPLMHFVDDVEFVFDTQHPGLIQVRSSSRVGYYDFGVNRSRVEKIRKAFEKRAS